MSRDLESMSKEELIRYVEEVRRIHADTSESVHLIHELQVHQVELEMQNQQLREAQAQLEESRARYVDLYDFAPVGYCTLDARGLLQDLNLRAAEIIGVERHCLAGKPLAQVVQFKEPNTFWAHLRRCVKGSETLSQEWELTARNGRQVVVHAVSVPARAADGSAVCRTALTDITEHKAAEQALHFLSEIGERLSASLDARAVMQEIARSAVPWLADVCLVNEVQATGKPTRVAAAAVDPSQLERLKALESRLGAIPAFTRLTRTALRTGRAQVDLNAGNHLHPRSGHDAESLKQLRSLNLERCAVVPLTVRGNALGTLTLLRQGNTGFQPRELRLAEEFGHRAAVAVENTRLFEQAQEASRLRDEFIAILSHDLRGSISAMKLAVDVLLRRGHSEERRRFGRNQLESIRRSVQSMAQLISDLLSSATIELGKLPMSPTPLAVAELLQEAVEPLQSLAQQKEVALEVVHDRAESQIVGDRQRLHQVFSNLVGNALKFTPPRGKVVVRAEAAGQGDVRFAIEDSGPGIPEESRPHLFDRYWQAQGEYRRGTGLGLWIAKSIVEAHHGTIWVESNLGRGSTFFFTVPSIAEDQAQPTAQA